MLPTLQVGPLALQVPGLMFLLALWLGLNLTEKFAPRRGMNAETLYNLIFAALISALIGARLSFAAQNFAIFTATPLSLISLNPGLLDPFGGFAAGLLAALIYGQRKKLALWQTLDVLTPFFAMMMAGLALSNAASGAAFGMETTLPWGIDLWGAKRHPTQFYALGLALANLALLGWQWKTTGWRDRTLFLFFVALTAGAWLFVEGFRGDSVILAGGFRAGQVLAWALMAAALGRIMLLDASKK
ncbi:MAG: hypothetical protein CO094_07895 [Anaerolineae bacterium CG_4_9_14_3_um_filter_57_17]|nr:prolipoprotein diacylglyceryl transferase [bacterium]NCT20968.1 prolipoprotein diacylglyceryl transferase [bacterium]OIO85096.1 MAG: hypothetical protein AUK01_07040 [Anaerolineae bacterium CG2_30_57_67]PJB66136.1 MAG: hypothetical protein CO094_07895 [Anaerolineae bacterium CG_4_9_14_3_um_filter_57_17]